MRLEMGLDTRLALQQKLVLSPQILQSIEILQMTNSNLLELIEAELQENPALECDVPEDTPVATPPAPAAAPEGTATVKTEEDEARGATETDAAPASTYEPEEWDEFRTRRSDGEDVDKKYEALQNSPGRGETAHDVLADQLRMLDAPERIRALADVIVYSLDDRGCLPPHKLAAPFLDALGDDGSLAKPLVDIVASALGVAAVKVPEAKRGVTPEQIAEAVDARERTLLEAQDVLSRIQRIRTADGNGLTRRDVLLRYPLVDLLDREQGDWTLEEAEQALALVQRLEPRGVGGRTLEETLVLQLDSEGLTYRELRDLIENHLDDLAKNRLPKIAKEMNCSVDDVKLLVEELRDVYHVGLMPGARLAEEAARAVHPDVVVTEEDGDFKVDLVNSQFPALSVRDDYVKLVNDKTQPTPVRDDARRRVDGARWLIEAIMQRQATLTKVAQRIFAHQRDFLVHGRTALRPLKMQTVADELGSHVSTVSRAIADKWVQTPQGIHTLKSFFVGGTENASGEVESRDNVKERVKEIIDKEDSSNPLSDDDVADRLKQAGLDVARRTVTKYRKQLGIASSRQRKAV